MISHTAKLLGDPAAGRSALDAKQGVLVQSLPAKPHKPSFVQRTAKLDPTFREWAYDMKCRARKVRLTNRQLADMLIDIGFEATEQGVSYILNAKAMPAKPVMEAVKNAIVHAEWERFERARAEKRDVIRLRGKG